MNAAPNRYVPAHIRSDWDFGEELISDLSCFVQEYLIEQIRLASRSRRSTQYEDCQLATDAMVSMPTFGEQRIVVRVRRLSSAGRYKDITFRCYRKGKPRQELQKIGEGLGDWFVYGWRDDRLPNAPLESWCLLDMNQFRLSGLCDELIHADDLWQSNRDGSSKFVAISREKLQDAGVLVAGVDRMGAAVQFRWKRFPNRHTQFDDWNES